MPLAQGQILQNRYRVVALLGQGGFGAVYRAWDMNLNKPVAIKENLDITSEAQSQFWHEAQILSNLTHPNLPRVTDHFFIQGQGQYLVMDFIEGEDLQAMLDRVGHPLSETQVLPWIEQICYALHYLHTQTPPIIHRDIKPANIKITPQGRAVLVDFGISKIYDPQLKTTAGARAVTPPYSPPEQYGHGTTDERSDIYALGATMYTLLTGREPPESVERVANNAVLTPPRQLVLSITLSVEATILRACETAKTNRFQSVAELQRSILSVGSSKRKINPTAVAVRAVTGFGLLAVVLVTLVLLFKYLVIPVAPMATLTTTAPSPTFTLSPTATATRTPTPTTLPTTQLRSIPISLEPFGNDDIRDILPSFPVDYVTLGRVKFLIARQNNKISTQCNVIGQKEWPTGITVSVGTISHPETIYLLINAGYAHTRYAAAQIGLVVLEFGNGNLLRFPLILGQNIREWKIADPGAVTTTTDLSSSVVWNGSSYDNRSAVLDMLTLSIPQDHRNSSLRAVTFYDTSQDTLDDLNPCFMVIGITIIARD